MIRNLFSSAMKLRLALWAVEMALPSGSDLKQRFKVGLLGIMAAVASGVLLAWAIAAVIAVITYWLYDNSQLTGFQAVLLTIGIVLLCTVGLFYVGRNKLKEAFLTLDQQPRRSEEDYDVFHELIQGFVEGIAKGPPVKEEIYPEYTAGAGFGHEAQPEPRPGYPRAA